MRKTLISFLYILLGILFVNAQDTQKLSSSTKDNFSLYLYAVQSELMGDIPSARQLYDMSILKSDSSVYMPSLLSSLNLRLAASDFGPETEKFLKMAYNSGADEKVLSDMMINFKIGKHEYSDAKSLCQKLLLQSPNNKSLVSTLAIIDYYNNKADSSLLRINDYESSFGFNPQLYAIKREILSQMNQYDSLLSYNIRVAELYPESLSILADLANVYAAVGNDSVAYSIWKDIESEDSTAIELVASRNFFYATRGYKKDAIVTTSQLLSSPYVKSEAKSEIFSQLFIAVDPRKDSIYFPLMDSLFYETSLSETDSTDVVRDIVLGYFFFRKDYNTSLRILSSLHSSLPDVPKYVVQTANILTLSNDYDSAFSLLDSAILASPHVTDFVLYKSELIKDKYGSKSCYSYLKNVIKKETSDSSLSHYYSYMGDLYYKDSLVNKAFKCYELSLKSNPDNPLALNNYAYFLALADQNLDKALGMSHKCNILIQSNPTYLDTEAYILYKLGRYKEAKELMDMVFSLSENDVSDEVLLHYADILAAMGNNIQARDYYKRAQKAGVDPSVIAQRLNVLK